MCVAADTPLRWAEPSVPFPPLLSLQAPRPRFSCLRGPGVWNGAGPSCPQQLRDLLPGTRRVDTISSGPTPLESEDEEETSLGVPDTSPSETAQPRVVTASEAGVALQR